MVSLSSKIKYNIIFVFYLLVLSVSFVSIFSSSSVALELQRESTEVKGVDQIAIKQREMLDPIVRVETYKTKGSGAVYAKIATEIDDIFEYRVLTNYHVTRTRIIFSLHIDFITGKLIKISTDTGCSVVVFDPDGQNNKKYTAKIVAEDDCIDLTILSFATDQPISIALLATDEMLKDIHVFGDVFAVGCQLGMRPIPTFGIISKITSGTTKEIKWILYGTTAQTAFGSSGGGLFREYDGHYYLIGIPFRVASTCNQQIIPHLTSAISLSTANNFLNTNSVNKE